MRREVFRSKCTTKTITKAVNRNIIWVCTDTRQNPSESNLYADKENASGQYYDIIGAITPQRRADSKDNGNKIVVEKDLTRSLTSLRLKVKYFISQKVNIFGTLWRKQSMLSISLETVYFILATYIWLSVLSNCFASPFIIHVILTSQSVLSVSSKNSDKFIMRGFENYVVFKLYSAN